MPDTDGNEIVGSGRGTSGDRSELIDEEYWTEERRAAAIPVPLPKAPGGAEALREEPGPPEPDGETGHTAQGHGSAKESGPHGDSRGTGGQAVANPLAYPYRTCGKLFFTQGGTGYAGSAAMVAPNVLLTAGHCVYDGGWSTNVAFYPSYGKRASTDSAYKFNYNYVAAWTAWSQKGNRAYDYGLVWFDSAPGNIIGWLGLLWNASTSGRTWDAVGYPATPNPPFNGAVMDHAVGQFASSSTAGTIGLTNDNMQHGSSGGPWITAWNEATPAHANGLQSFHINDGDTIEYGPYFNQDVKGLFDWISNPANRH
jgi:V8-like Glu-specific endopeptidase